MNAMPQLYLSIARNQFNPNHADLNLGHESRKESRTIAGVVELVDTGDLKFHYMFYLVQYSTVFPG
jgi:hypothetical protein